MNKRKILAITGARSEYDLLFSVYEKLNNDSRFDFSILVTGPHLSERFGLTAKYISNDGFKIEDYIFNLLDSDQKIGRVISIGHQIPSMAQTFYRCNPDIVLVAGDREEAISATMAAAFMDIPVAHFFGGDIAKDGNIDNAVRYAASKFAHIHFPTLKEHKETLLKLGEDDWRIFVTGNPALDRFISTPQLTASEISSNIGRDLPAHYFVLIYHSIVTEVEKQEKHISIILESIRKTGTFCFLNFPNSDPGNAAIIEAYRQYSLTFPDQFALFQNLDRTTYINLLRNAKCLLGNSSSGLLEAPSLGLAAINVGSRQRGRVHGQNVIFVDFDEGEIVNAIDFVCNNREFRSKLAKKENPYGDGNSAEAIVEVLASIRIDNELIHKNITY